MFLSLIHILVRKAANTSSLYWFKDILADSCDDLRINGYAFKGTVYCINSLRSYFKANIELRTHAKARELFKEDWPIHTRTNDSAPSQYLSLIHIFSRVMHRRNRMTFYRIGAVLIASSAVVLVLCPTPVSYTHLDVYKRQGHWAKSAAAGR